MLQSIFLYVSFSHLHPLHIAGLPAILPLIKKSERTNPWQPFILNFLSHLKTYPLSSRPEVCGKVTQAQTSA